jgi:hypothetical protein
LQSKLAAWATEVASTSITSPANILEIISQLRKSHAPRRLTTPAAPFAIAAAPRAF